MTPEERKRGMHAAVIAHFKGHHLDSVLDRKHQMLWEIIHSLVDEVAAVRHADSPEERGYSTIRSLLHYIAKDLGVADEGKQVHAVELTRSIRKAIADRIVPNHDPNCPACNGAWPWCEACRSYHSPCNPSCKAKVRPADSPEGEK